LALDFDYRGPFGTLKVMVIYIKKSTCLTVDQTFVCGALSFFALPNSLQSASFLTAEEKQFGEKRLMLDSPGSLEG
jgi:hypothetical protein